MGWHRPPGRPRRTGLRTIELNFQQHNLGLNLAWKRAQDRSKWRKLVETAMSCQGRDDDDGPATENARRPNLVRRCRGTMR